MSPEPTARVTLLEHVARVACWPSTGGVWIKHASRPDLDFLDLDHRHDTARRWPYNGTEEDGFCARMRLLSAQFWGTPPTIEDLECLVLESCVKPSLKGELEIAWPSDGGTTMLNITELKENDREVKALKALPFARDMDERSFVLNGRHGVWCHVEPYVCERMWCEQYRDFCEEGKILWE